MINWKVLYKIFLYRSQHPKCGKLKDLACVAKKVEKEKPQLHFHVLKHLQDRVRCRRWGWDICWRIIISLIGCICFLYLNMRHFCFPKVVTKAPVDCMCRPCTGVDEGSILPQEMAGYLEGDGSSSAMVFPVRIQL